jgi:hypothetical protein
LELGFLGGTASALAAANSAATCFLLSWIVFQRERIRTRTRGEWAKDCLGSSAEFHCVLERQQCHLYPLKHPRLQKQDHRRQRHPRHRLLE